jgi:hypothetical protein
MGIDARGHVGGPAVVAQAIGRRRNALVIGEDDEGPGGLLQAAGIRGCAALTRPLQVEGDRDADCADPLRAGVKRIFAALRGLIGSGVDGPGVLTRLSPAPCAAVVVGGVAPVADAALDRHALEHAGGARVIDVDIGLVGGVGALSAVGVAAVEPLRPQRVTSTCFTRP